MLLNRTEPEGTDGLPIGAHEYGLGQMSTAGAEDKPPPVMITELMLVGAPGFCRYNSKLAVPCIDGVLKSPPTMAVPDVTWI